MTNELINLLPEFQQKLFRREYFIRVVTVALILLSVVVLLSAVFLVPTFIFLNQDVLSKSSELQKLSKSQTAEEQLAQTESAALQTEAKNLAAHDTTPTASAVLQTILAVSHSGIALEGFTYTPPDATGKGSLEINGTADTREDLRNYDESLSALPYITNADLPISDYAAESNIVFTITLTGTFTQT